MINHSSKNEVKKSFYLGEKYRISAKLGDDIIDLYHNTNLMQGSNLYIDCKKRNLAYCFNHGW